MKNQKLILMKKLSFSVKERFCSNPCSHKACPFMFNTTKLPISHQGVNKGKKKVIK